jgi:cell division transport system permease protein
MALKLDYVARETATNLTRNVTLTVASIVTIGVSLALFGSTLLLNRALDNATQRWRGGIEFIVFMQPSVTDDQLAAMEEDLQASPDIESVEYVDKQETYEEFVRLFEDDSPTLVDTVTPDILPTSFKVVPRITDTEVISALGEQFEDKAGVREVVFAEEVIRALERIFGKVGIRLLLAAVTLLVAALLLILNTIRVAMFARRHEIEVMKLVGATNWFIRVPFVVEGVVQALLGSILAIGGLFAARSLIDGLNEEKFPLFQDFAIQNEQLLSTGVIVVLIGILVGAVGSAFAATRFLDV